jgi:hypothetical protein
LLRYYNNIRFIIEKSDQINALLQNFSSLRDENEFLKKNLSPLLSGQSGARNISEERAIEDDEEKLNYQNLEYVISKKANKYYQEEVLIVNYFLFNIDNLHKAKILTSAC